MEPSAGIELPPPIQPESLSSHQEQSPSLIGEIAPDETAPEKAAAPAPAPEKAAPLPTSSPPSLPAEDTATLPDDIQPGRLQVVFPATAADTDKIEPGWVRAAEVIIAQTQKDPYNQGKAIENVRTQYRQKRSGTSMPEAA